MMQCHGGVHKPKPETGITIQGLHQHARRPIRIRQQCREPTVTLSKVFLPRTCWILVMPCLVPYGHAWQADCGKSCFLGTKTIFNVIEFDEHWHGETDFLHNRNRNQTHPPPIEVFIDALMTIRRVTERFHREIMVVPHALGRVHPHSLRIDPLTLRIQHGAIIQMEHAAADKNWSHRVIRELDCTQDRFRFADGIIVQQQHKITITGLSRFIHASGESSRTTQVRLLNVCKLFA